MKLLGHFSIDTYLSSVLFIDFYMAYIAVLPVYDSTVPHVILPRYP